ncbi:MAG: TerB family tellurite resistance protein [Candidatus Hydrogenedentota bacterium]
MLSRILELFHDATQDEEQPSTEERVRLATAAILVECARADETFSHSEKEHVIETLRQRFQLPQEEAEELLRESKQSLRESSDLWTFTNALNEALSPDEKTEILEEAWRIIFLDGALHAHEDYLIHKLARLLNLTHPELIEAKMKVLEEVRNSPEP